MSGAFFVCRQRLRMRDNPAVIPDISVFSENSKGGAKIAP
jgi:hypothetical protein